MMWQHLGSLLLVLGCLTVAQAEEPFVPQMTVYRDATLMLDLDAVQHEFAAGNGAVTRSPWPTFGFTKDAVWARFVLAGQEQGITRLLELRTARMDEWDWFVVRTNGHIESHATGNMRPPDPALISGRYPLLLVTLAPHEQVEIYVRAYSQTSVHVPLFVWIPEAYVAAQPGKEAFSSGFFGYLLALIILSFVFSLSTSERGFLIYSLSLIGLLINYFIVSGYYAWLAWPGVPFAVHGGTILASESAMWLLLLYLRHFFDMPQSMPRLDRYVILPLLILVPLMTALMLLEPYRVSVQWMLFQALAWGALSLAVSLYAWIKGNRIARFYALAWIFFWILFGAAVAQFQGWLVSPVRPEQQSMLGLAVSVTFFLVAMADRVRQLRDRMQASQIQIIGLERKISENLKDRMNQQQQLLHDLHDGLGGLAANLGVLAEIGRRESTRDTDAERFERLGGLAAEIGSETRSLMNALDVEVLSWADIVVECRRIGDLCLAPHEIVFDCSVEGAPEQAPGLPPLTGISLLRVFKEAVTNVVKHARARRMTVMIRVEPTIMTMTLRDDGIGLGKPHENGRGLRGMAKRIEAMGGTLASMPGPGTEWYITLPLPVKTKNV